MIKRIQDLKAIGPFLDDHPASVQFEPLTFIYGENCYGKTTLCDIFRSLDENSPQYLTDRTSVPNPDNHRQHVQLGFLTAGNDTETPLVFDGNEWNPKLPVGSRLLVFDTDFIHRNLFTGTVIERMNRENLTRFIFGETGTKLAERIGHLNSHLRTVNTDIHELQRVIFADIQDLNLFIALQVDEDLEEIQTQQNALTPQIAQKTALLNDLGRASNRTEPRIVRVPEEFHAFVQSVNDVLGRTYQRVHLDAAKAVSTHIQRKTAALQTTEQWLSLGIDHLQNEDCPFCGQVLQEDATDLINAYREHFDVVFRRFVAEVTNALHQFPSQLDVFHHPGVQQQVLQNSISITEYPELTDHPNFQPYIVQHNALGRALVVSWESWQTHFNNASRTLADCIRAKQTSLHVAMDEWDCGEAISAYAELVKKTMSYNEVINQIIAQISAFKEGLNADVLREEIAALGLQYTDLLLKQRRHQLSAACIQYSQLLEDKVNTTNEIKRLEDELDKEQTQFIDNYFDKINHLFSRLGSSGFSISMVRTRRGNMPVITITPSYSGVPIPPDKISAFFSESDRRALALSIFWAKADLMPEQEKHSSILILDDPVTSFDEGRIERTIRLIDGARTPFRQVIVLSHYPRFLKSFFDRAHLQSGDIRVARIFKDQNSSKLETASIIDFTETEHQAKLRHIVNFIENQHREDICLDLRVFLEEEVRSRYGKQILDSRITSTGFRDLLDALKDSGAISEDLRNEIEPFRLSLNPSHHTWVGGTHENKVAFASDVLDFVYSRL